jgi:hypothetical protein
MRVDLTTFLSARLVFGLPCETVAFRTPCGVEDLDDAFDRRHMLRYDCVVLGRSALPPASDWRHKGWLTMGKFSARQWTHRPGEQRGSGHLRFTVDQVSSNPAAATPNKSPTGMLPPAKPRRMPTHSPRARWFISFVSCLSLCPNMAFTSLMICGDIVLLCDPRHIHH